MVTSMTSALVHSSKFNERAADLNAFDWVWSAASVAQNSLGRLDLTPSYDTQMIRCFCELLKPNSTRNTNITPSARAGKSDFLYCRLVMWKWPSCPQAYWNFKPKNVTSVTYKMRLLPLKTKLGVNIVLWTDISISLLCEWGHWTAY